MLLIPELETVFIRVPRTASRSLKMGLQKRYPKSIEIYHHMEADGVPRGYDRWKKVGFVRHPLERLWSVYKYCKAINTGTSYWQEKMRRSTLCSFNDWILNNDVVFTDPYDSGNNLVFYPHWTVGHALPENRKSQFLYLRPDLGTQIYNFEDELQTFIQEFDIHVEVSNSSPFTEPMPISDEAKAYIRKVFAWDLQHYCGELK